VQGFGIAYFPLAYVPHAAGQGGDGSGHTSLLLCMRAPLPLPERGVDNTTRELSVLYAVHCSLHYGSYATQPGVQLWGIVDIGRGRGTGMGQVSYFEDSRGDSCLEGTG